MKNIFNRILILTPLILSLSSCAWLGAVSGLVSGLGATNNSGSQESLSLDTELSNQQGDNNYTGQGGKVKTDKIQQSKVAGNNQNNYSASSLTVNHDSFWKTLWAFIIGFILCAVAMFLFGLYLPQPKHTQKLKSMLHKSGK